MEYKEYRRNKCLQVLTSRPPSTATHFPVDRSSVPVIGLHELMNYQVNSLRSVNPLFVREFNFVELAFAG